ncbi:MAG: hypothetical protein UGE37_06345 [Dialister hominis]|uniref:hypothetical protein n=1 Tax=Dialister hominis TaxID=2582419 RepID=UPI002E9A6775|nr:hypothetical protein [Dialister hominis]
MLLVISCWRWYDIILIGNRGEKYEASAFRYPVSDTCGGGISGHFPICKKSGKPEKTEI